MKPETPEPAPLTSTAEPLTEPIFERQPAESAKAFEAAQMYYELGPQRSHAAVAKALHKQVSLINRWSGRWRWVEHARAWDRAIERARHAEIQKQVAAEAQSSAIDSVVTAQRTTLELPSRSCLFNRVMTLAVVLFRLNL